MNILVLNLGSTSLKYRLYDMTDERVIASGSIEGVGSTTAQVRMCFGTSAPHGSTQRVADQTEAVDICLRELSAARAGWTAPQIDAVAFKAVHGGPLAEAMRVTPAVLAVMSEYAAAAPAHNPSYIVTMRALARLMPGIPLVAAFETGFHQTISAARRTYAIPWDWTTRYGIQRYGFHGASHRYVATHTAELLGRTDLRIISCHLGGSSSVCAIRAGRSVANSFGFTPQTGLPQNNRVGEFDPFALPVLMEKTKKSVEGVLAALSSQGGLLGISGISNDMERIIAAAQAGNERAELALQIFTESVRDHVGAYLLALGGLDALVFTGGIGERSPEVRKRVCEGLEFIGVRLDSERNALGGADASVSADDSRVKVLAMQTNEELMVARQARGLLEQERVTGGSEGRW